MSSGGHVGPPLDSLPRRQARAGGYAFRLLSRALVGDLPDATALVIGDVDGAVRPLSDSRGAVRGAVRLLHSSREPVGENLVLCRIHWLSAREGNEHHVVSLLRAGRSVPRPVECYERAALVVGGEKRSRIEHQSIRGPVS